MPTYLRRRNGELYVEDISLASLAEAHGTPLFVYSASEMRDAYDRVDHALREVTHLIAFAVKANSNLAVLKHFALRGSGADVVSGGELMRALKAGFPPDRIVFSGVGKTDEEIAAALEAQIRSINIESVSELAAVERVAQRLGVRARIGLRVNPDVDAATHPYIATGLHDAKFGLELATAEGLLPRLAGAVHLELESVGCHIGSQLGDPSSVRDAARIVGGFAARCLAQGRPLTSIDIGGGWPVGYGDEDPAYAPLEAYGAAAVEGLRASGVDLSRLTVLTEPGRCLVAKAGVLLTRVLYRKPRSHKHFVIVDAAMTELLRPALYQAYHHILSVEESAEGAEKLRCDVVGPVCETGDFLALDRRLPEVPEGSLLAVLGAGAYASVMGSNYNSRPRPAEIWVDGANVRVVRRRESQEDLWRLECM